jgi:uncharacterized protein involved in response to NO
VELVRKDEVKPQPPAGPRTSPDPYRVLFPLGIAAAMLGLLPWVYYALSLAPWWPTALAPGWPAASHAALLAQGFELAFVCGFLLTAMPAFTHGPRCTGRELAAVTAAVALFIVLRAAGVTAAAWAWLVSLALLAFVVGRRVRPGAAAPPEEFLLVATGLALGLAGGIVQAMAASGWAPPTAERAGVRCVSLGMLPALVLGLGALLVPTFTMMKNPLDIVGVARAGQRPRRRAFTLAIAVLLVAALHAELTGFVTLAGWLRAAAVIASTQLAWKIWRAPGRRDRLSWSLWIAGWCVTVGFTLAALFPIYRIEAWHVAFVGGYALLTLGIGTRVVISHGGHAMTEERAVLTGGVVTALLAALLVRAFGPVADPERLPLHHAVASALALLAFVRWLQGAWPRVRRTRRRTTLVAPPVAPVQPHT